MATKQQERDALNKIRQITEALGRDSYVGTAFKGVFEIAELNIEYDAALSLAEELESARAERKAAKEEKAELAEQLKRLKEKLEKEEEWAPRESDLNVKQADYEAIAASGATIVLPEAEAKQLIADEFGFDPAKITILHSVDKEEINRHRLCRKVGELARKPIYNATDWNYIRFDCASWHYEMHNGKLRPFYC